MQKDRCQEFADMLQAIYSRAPIRQAHVRPEGKQSEKRILREVVNPSLACPLNQRKVGRKQFVYNSFGVSAYFLRHQ